MFAFFEFLLSSLIKYGLIINTLFLTSNTISNLLRFWETCFLIYLNTSINIMISVSITAVPVRNVLTNILRLLKLRNKIQIRSEWSKDSLTIKKTNRQTLILSDTYLDQPESRNILFMFLLDILRYEKVWVCLKIFLNDFDRILFL